MTIEITGHTRLCGIFGDPVEHSRSPRLHSTAFKMADADYRYLAFRIEEKDLGRAIESARLFNMRGFNLTMPHKIAVIPFLDRLDPAVDLIGAVNTVVNEDGELIGYNTDGYGFMKTFAVHGHPVAGKKMTQMGIGGAGTAVAAQAALDGAREIAVFSPGDGKSWERAGKEVALIAEKTGCSISLHDANDYDDLRAEIASSDLLANMTPLGMGALEGKSPIPDASFLHEGLVVQDAIYAPPETALLKMAKEAGAEAINGLEMLTTKARAASSCGPARKCPYRPKKWPPCSHTHPHTASVRGRASLHDARPLSFGAFALPARMCHRA